jgi:hypothetical protein
LAHEQRLQPILNIVDKAPVHVVLVYGEIVSATFDQAKGKPPEPPGQEKKNDPVLVFAQSGRSGDLFVIEAASRKFCQDETGQIWYAVGGFMSWEGRKPIDINPLARNVGT